MAVEYSKLTDINLEIVTLGLSRRSMIVQLNSPRKWTVLILNDLDKMVLSLDSSEKSRRSFVHLSYVI